MHIIDTLMVCQDCIMEIANGDLTGLDYHLDHDEATARAIEIRSAIASFYPHHLVPGGTDEDGEEIEDDEFSARDCDCCGSWLAGSRHPVTLLSEEAE